MRKLFFVLAVTFGMLLGTSALKGAWIEGGNPLPVAFSRMVLFDTAGTYTWTVPDGVYKIKVEMWGGGGGGAYYDGSGYRYTCGGGGGGYGLAVIDVTPGQVCAITVGTGGSPGANGGNSIIVCGTTTYTAFGGHGATTDSYDHSCDPGAGDTATTPFFLRGEDGGRYYAHWSDDRYYSGFPHGGSSPRGGFGGFRDPYTSYSSPSSPGGGGYKYRGGAPGAVIIWY